MKIRLCFAIAFAVVSLNAAELRFVTIGDISAIDVKKKTVTIKDATSFNITSPVDNGRGASAAGSGGPGRGGGAGRRGGRNTGGGGGVPRYGSAGPSAPIPMEFKVVFSSKTLVKQTDNAITFDDLKVGDRIQVSSAKGGTKIEAVEVDRVPKE
jgi:hypothetical protein